MKCLFIKLKNIITLLKNTLNVGMHNQNWLSILLSWCKSTENHHPFCTKQNQPLIWELGFFVCLVLFCFFLFVVEGPDWSLWKKFLWKWKYLFNFFFPISTLFTDSSHPPSKMIIAWYYMELLLLVQNKAVKQKEPPTPLSWPSSGLVLFWRVFDLQQAS